MRLLTRLFEKGLGGWDVQYWVAGGLLPLLIIVWLFASAATASAHAVVVAAQPSEGEVLDQTPSKIVLRFNSSIEKTMTHLVLSEAGGWSIKLAAPLKSGAPNLLDIPLPPLTNGEYTLRYRVLATDGHVTPGQLRFTVSGGTQ